MLRAVCGALLVLLVGLPAAAAQPPTFPKVSWAAEPAAEPADPLGAPQANGLRLSWSCSVMELASPTEPFQVQFEASGRTGDVEFAFDPARVQVAKRLPADCRDDARLYYLNATVRTRVGLSMEAYVPLEQRVRATILHEAANGPQRLASVDTNLSVVAAFAPALGVNHVGGPFKSRYAGERVRAYLDVLSESNGPTNVQVRVLNATANINVTHLDTLAGALAPRNWYRAEFVAVFDSSAHRYRSTATANVSVVLSDATGRSNATNETTVQLHFQADPRDSFLTPGPAAALVLAAAGGLAGIRRRR